MIEITIEMQETMRLANESCFLGQFYELFVPLPIVRSELSSARVEDECIHSNNLYVLKTKGL